MGVPERTNVIVVGAGASQEFDLPTGAKLTSIIQRDLDFQIDRFFNLAVGNGDWELMRAIEALSRQTKVRLAVYGNAAQQISRNMALAPSIDNYLDTHKDNPNLVNVGKLAIANAIIKAEHQSSLYINPNNTFNRLDFAKTTNTWTAVFFKIIAAKRDYASFLKALSNITFISFNYDRCIKQFFGNAAASYFELDGQKIEEVLTAIRVIHPYGVIGELNVSNNHVVGYGLEANGGRILSASNNIRTFTEGVADRSLLDSIKKPLEQAELVIFLGFSFIDINMQILRPDRAQAKRVLATAKGRSEDTKLSLKNNIEQNFTRFNKKGESVEMFEGKCFELFYEFDHYLTSSQST